MFEEYQKKVLLDYENKLKAGALSTNLVDRTTAKLKKECLELYQERYREETDQYAIKGFFGRNDIKGDYTDLIKKIDVDRFRPLIKWMRKDIVETDRKNIELLAWLIDFKPRPFNAGNFNGPKLEEPGKPPGKGYPGITDRFNLWVRKNAKKIAIAFLTTAGAIGGGYFIFIKLPDPQCMYWAGDHYQPVSCGKKIHKTAIIAIDTMKVVHFKKITRTDTLTTYSLGRVWYVKINGVTECFTSDGYHPIYTEKMLKPITITILRGLKSSLD